MEQGCNREIRLIPAAFLEGSLLESSETSLGFPWSSGVKVGWDHSQVTDLGNSCSQLHIFPSLSFSTPAKNSFFLQFLSLLQPCPDLGLPRLPLYLQQNRAAVPFTRSNSFIPPSRIPEAPAAAPDTAVPEQLELLESGIPPRSSRGCSRL